MVAGIWRAAHDPFDMWVALCTGAGIVVLLDHELTAPAVLALFRWWYGSSLALPAKWHTSLSTR